jgi:hypothetical protein
VVQAPGDGRLADEKVPAGRRPERQPRNGWCSVCCS